MLDLPRDFVDCKTNGVRAASSMARISTLKVYTYFARTTVATVLTRRKSCSDAYPFITDAETSDCDRSIACMIPEDPLVEIS
ncbi:hypothetical protein J6590_044548 [Homalodisca vitripennis]|nr:hypothetical protein J6590_044548 [Homalodisca vitripennis]